jgi:hypothetical protein
MQDQVSPFTERIVIDIVKGERGKATFGNQKP